MTGNPKALQPLRQAWLFILSTLLGVALIGWGGALGPGNDLLKNLLISLGGAVTGASVGLLASFFRIQSNLERTESMLQNTLSPGIVCTDETLQQYRKLWHHYYVTQSKGRLLWHYSTLDFSTQLAVGRLIGEQVFAEDSHRPQKARVQAGLWGKRGVFLYFSPGGAASAVEVYPDLGTEFLEYQCGLVFELSWDVTNVVTASILSEKPMAANVTPGLVEDDDVAGVLDEKWRSQFTGQNVILPRIIGRVSATDAS